jgi:hypothetical protein
MTSMAVLPPDGKMAITYMLQSFYPMRGKHPFQTYKSSPDGTHPPREDVDL